MKYRTRENIFNFIMVKIRKILYFILRLDIHKKFHNYIIKNTGYIPVLSVNPKKKVYRFNCYCFTCPCNFKGLCKTQFFKIPKNQLHKFDGDNILQNWCG